ncbi:MAG: 4Fe-4S binding protein [Spirochaetaceae bacterium]|jgi:ferredoxin|nr:4Fe-4S binding protein [Spirochaetaceae bacterium]
MIRTIIEIDGEKCDGCGQCVTACHEGAIALTGGKARLVREDYCDGLGNCLPSCPAGAIRFTEREALPCTPPKEAAPYRNAAQAGAAAQAGGAAEFGAGASRLGQWPVQIKLVPVNAPYFENADILVAADCSAYARADFHERFMRDKITLIGCPKLDDGDYREKLTAIFRTGAVKSVTVVRMEVPCCGGITAAVKGALDACGKTIPAHTALISTGGKILAET